MADGQITEVGSYNELIDNDGAFAQFLQTYKGVDEDQDKNHQCKLKPLYKSLTCWHIFVAREHTESSSSATDRQELYDDTESAAKEDKQKMLISEEKTEKGRITFAVILAYCRACTWYMTIFVLLFNVLSNTFAVVTNFWLADWSNAAENLNSPGELNVTIDHWQVTACDNTDSPK